MLNGSARILEFTQTRLITPDMSLGSGALSSLSVNGRPVNVDAIEGGSLSANFLIRDTVAADFQIRIDALSVDLIERFQNPAIDPTLTAGDAGMFTDAGSIYNSTNEVGISGRIAVNELVDPTMGGDIWRLRDGLGAVIPGVSGESSQLIRMADALADSRPAAANMGLSSVMSGASFAEEITSYWASESQRSEEANAHKQSLHSVLRIEELHATGVDTDKEMQTLLVVEQAYAANAHVLSVLDGLMKKLLEM